MKDSMYDSMYKTERQHWWFHAKREIVLALGQPYLKAKNLNLVDFGCGCGAMLEALQTYGNVTGMDFSDRALRYCNERFGGRLMKLDLSEPIDGESENSYDFGVALDVLEHIDDDLSAVKNIFAMMRDGGTCIFTVPAYQWLWTSHDENCMHKRRYNKSGLQTILAEAGFEIEYISYYNFYLFLPAAVVRLLSKVLPIDRGSAWENHFSDSWSNQMLYRIFSREKNAISKRKPFPFGLSLIALCRTHNEE